ncbi:MAG: FkbM family methyltransferase [Cyanobacteria bacterium SBLK]|nr:FkbM family methyltransferase [Cyanobacteria bacterium SBLK]
MHYLNRPEYILQPLQIYRRLRRPPNQPIDEFRHINLPWGMPFRIRPNPDDKVEWSLWIMGVYDLALSESLWRLTELGETAIDIGANIGYMTGIMAEKVGKSGRVIAFEPCPVIADELEYNIQTWRDRKGWNCIEAKKIALSSSVGTGFLRLPTYNRGEAAIIENKEAVDRQETLEIYEVELNKLDNIVENKTKIGVLKIDIEGHELSAFQGAENLLKSQKIRDIFFESHQGYPTPASEFLESCGYEIFRLWKGFWKPLLYPANYSVIHPWEPPNYLATLNGDRARKRLKQSGWSILKGKTHRFS